MNVHEAVIEAVGKFKVPATPAQIQAELIPPMSYAILHNTLNELVRSGKIIESRNELDKRVFSVKGGGAA